MVVTTTVSTRTYASALAPPSRMNPGVNRSADSTTPMNLSIAPTEPPTIVNVMNDATIAEISLQELMRHQYQRRMNTNPVPAPRPIRNFHADATELRFIVTMIDSRKSTTVAERDTATKWASDAFLR